MPFLTINLPSFLQKTCSNGISHNNNTLLSLIYFFDNYLKSLFSNFSRVGGGVGRLSTDTNYKQVVYNIQYFWPGVYRNFSEICCQRDKITLNIRMLGNTSQGYIVLKLFRFPN